MRAPYKSLEDAVFSGGNLSPKPKDWIAITDPRYLFFGGRIGRI